MYGDRLNIVTV